jgi:hypothetical protein
VPEKSRELSITPVATFYVTALISLTMLIRGTGGITNSVFAPLYVAFGIIMNIVYVNGKPEWRWVMTSCTALSVLMNVFPLDGSDPQFKSGLMLFSISPATYYSLIVWFNIVFSMGLGTAVNVAMQARTAQSLTAVAMKTRTTQGGDT